MVPNILQVLTTAIKQKRCVAIRYHGQAHIRVIEPHAIYTADNGEVVVDGFQTRGYSASGRPPPFWRPFRVKKITAVSMLKETFTTRTDEGFSATKMKYRNGLVALVDDRRKSFSYPPQALSQEMGPHLPKNPHRR
jgi:hypothetical protein